MYPLPFIGGDTDLLYFLTISIVHWNLVDAREMAAAPTLLTLILNSAVENLCLWLQTSNNWLHLHSVSTACDLRVLQWEKATSK